MQSVYHFVANFLLFQKRSVSRLR